MNSSEFMGNYRRQGKQQALALWSHQLVLTATLHCRIKDPWR
jgi:hypothetical protein